MNPAIRVRISVGPRFAPLSRVCGVLESVDEKTRSMTPCGGGLVDTDQAQDSRDIRQVLLKKLISHSYSRLQSYSDDASAALFLLFSLNALYV